MGTFGNFRVFKHSGYKSITSLDGVDGARSRNRQWAGPSGLAAGPDGSVYVADSGGDRVVRILPNGTASIFAGTGWGGYSGDEGPAIGARLSHPTALFIDARGGVYIADTGNDVIRKVDARGIITTFSSGLNKPQALAGDSNGHLIIADTNNDRIVAIEPDGTMHTIAGTVKSGVSGDGVDAREEALDRPCALASGSDGTIYIADCGSGQVRKLLPN